MGIVIGVHNTKGGVGKTVSSIIVASILAARHKVLVIDLDPIASLTFAVGLTPKEFTGRSIERAIDYGTPVQSLVIPVPQFRFDLIPASPSLADAQLGGRTQSFGDVQSLKETIAPLREQYEFTLIDTQPTKSLLTLMPLVASDFLLIPVSTDSYAVRAFALSFRMVRTYVAENNPNLKILGVLPTMYQRRTRLSTKTLDILRQLCTTWSINMFTEPVPFSIRYAETGSEQRPIKEMTKDPKILGPYEVVAQWAEHVAALQGGAGVGHQA